MPRKDTLDHLTRLYQASDDPWDHRTSPFEAGKYAATLSAIGPGPFRAALEIGCGNGTFAARLAPRCTRLTVMDCIPAAIRSARQVLAPLAQVAVIQGAAPHDLPRLRPDLVVLSEVLYFLTPDEIAGLGLWLRSHATGPVVAVNWTGPTDEPLDGAAAVVLLARSLGAGTTDHHDGFRIDRFDPGA